MSALFLHLGLERPSSQHAPENTKGKVLIWGVSSSFGAFSAQVARDAGYAVVGVASARHRQLALDLNAAHFVDRNSSSVVQDLISLGPFKAVLAAADSAADQPKIGQVLAAQGGGHFLSTMGVRDGVKLPEGVTGFFRQFLDDYLDPKNKEFIEWVWWNYFEAVFADGRIKSVPLEMIGGLSQVQHAWDLLKADSVSGKRLIISPNSN